ncbi:MAG: hypothetical protein AMJ81_07965 [Phycisphaerae bacterium SM23_33]|nr:MAG: hypothetical protein AMJ81_07965 [Phycisphaerae bacterium SM23_33]
MMLLAGCSGQGEVATSEHRFVYTVREGDGSLTDVAKRVYGDSKHVSLIQQANPSVEPDALEPGTKLVIPPLTGDEGQLIAPKECQRQKIY